ncbi:MAG: DVUA0089 family protein [Planctomycetota bacterium]
MHKTLAIAAVAGLASAAAAQSFTYSAAGPALVISGSPEIIDLTAFGSPTGTFTGFSVDVDWSNDFFAFSNEARVAFGDGSQLISGSVAANNGGASTASVPALNFTGEFAAGTLGSYNPITDVTSQTVVTNEIDPAAFAGFDLIASQVFDGSSADWNSIIVTLNNDAPVNTVTGGETGPADFGYVDNGDIGTIPLGFSQSVVTTTPDIVNWVTFTHDGGFLRINTNNSEAFDTELILFDAAGDLVEADDDGSVQFRKSQLLFADLPAGDYALATGEFDIFTNGAAFGVGSDDFGGGGGEGINLNFFIPTPGSAAMLGLAGLAAARRRR